MARELPRVGGLIEDETGAWIIEEVRVAEGGVMISDHDGNRVWRRFEDLGPVHYEQEARIPEYDEGDGSNYAEAEDH